MEFKDFIESGIISIIFQSKSEQRLLQFLNGFSEEYDIEFMVDNPFRIEDVLNKTGLLAMRDKKLDQILGNKPIKKNLLIVDLNMISSSKESHYNVYREFFEKLNKNNYLECGIIILSRVNTRDARYDLDTSGKNSSVHISNTILNYCHSAFSLNSNNELNIVKCREGSNFSKVI
jgi:hypothetical protein